jgi:hypothetical protein
LSHNGGDARPRVLVNKQSPKRKAADMRKQTIEMRKGRKGRKGLIPTERKGRKG